MRVYGRVYSPDRSTWTWYEVDTDSTGGNDAVYATALIQVIKLQLGESPFYASYGIPAIQSVQTQVPPDYYVALTQQRYAQFFGSLIITRSDAPRTNLKQAFVPTYDVKVLTHQGTPLPTAVPE